MSGLTTMRARRLPDSAEDTQDPRIAIEHVAKTYVTRGLWPLVRRNSVLVDASLQVPAGEVVAIIGANGSGKSTLMKIIAGMLEADAGEVRIDGRLGYCPQAPVLYDKLTVEETFRLFGVAYGMDSALTAARTTELLEALSFRRFNAERVEYLSGGSQQKLNLAIALLPDPEVLLLDEPYAGFDYETYLRFWELTSDLVTRDRSILIISHFVAEQDRFDRIYRVTEGRCERDR